MAADVGRFSWSAVSVLRRMRTFFSPSLWSIDCAIVPCYFSSPVTPVQPRRLTSPILFSKCEFRVCSVWARQKMSPSPSDVILVRLAIWGEGPSFAAKPGPLKKTLPWAFQTAHISVSVKEGRKLMMMDEWGHGYILD